MNNIYKYAAVSGYDENSPGINDTIDNLQSTGNAQLDISIMAYNIGPGNAINSGFGYCGKESIKKKCHSPGQSNRVHNYLPNYRTGKITSIGYLEEVAGYMESFSWIRKYI